MDVLYLLLPLEHFIRRTENSTDQEDFFDICLTIHSIADSIARMPRVISFACMHAAKHTREERRR
jgi:hypothetical protein